MTNKKHLAGAKLVLTGDFAAHERDEATRLLEELGADVTGSVSGKTMAVIVGKNAGANKLGEAKKRNLPLLDEKALLALIAGKTLDEVLANAKQGEKPGAESAKSSAATVSKTEPAAQSTSKSAAKKAEAKPATTKSNGKHLAGAKIVLTGDFDAHDRGAATRLLEELGADVTGSVSGKTMAVIVGRDPGATKLSAAEDKGIPLLKEKDMLALLAGKTLDEVIANAANAANASDDDSGHDDASGDDASGDDGSGDDASGDDEDYSDDESGEIDDESDESDDDGRERATKSSSSRASASAVNASSGANARPRPPIPSVSALPRDGVYEERFANRQLRVQGAYKDGLKHGSWKAWHENGQLSEDYSWERGLKHGPELDWAKNGTQTCEGQNKRGVREGKWTWHYENGKHNQTCTYVNGQRQGEYTWDLEDGTPRARGQWRDDKMIGSWVWHAEGNFEKLERSYIDNGVQHGKDVAWHKGGKLAYERAHRFGALEGEEERFDVDGKPTFKGEWRGGFAVGTHITWDAEGNETRTTFVDGLPEDVVADGKRRDKALKKLKKAKDHYAKQDAIGEVVEYSERAPYAFQLWKCGHYDVASDHELWDLLQNAAALFTGDDVVAFLKKMKPAGAHCDVLPTWPRDIDRIVLDVYARDPKPIDAARASLPAPVQSGIALVRARFGHDIGDALHKELPALVKRHVEEYGLGEIYWPDEHGAVVSQKLFSDFRGTRTPLFDKLVAWFGGMDAWVNELRPRAFAEANETVSRVSFRFFRDLIERATPAEMSKLVNGIALDSDTQDLIEVALTQWRKDDAAALMKIALGVEDTGLRKWPTVSVAILAFAREGKPVPQELVDALPLASESPTYTSSWHGDPVRVYEELERHKPAVRMAAIDSAIGFASPRTKLLHRAMRALTPQQARSVVERHLAAQYGKTIVAQFLYLVEDTAVWERAFDFADADTYGHADTVMYGFGELGLRAVPMLIARKEKAQQAKKREQRDGWAKAVLFALARGVVDKGTFPEDFDEHVTVDVVKEDYYWHGYAPAIERVLWKLPQERAERIVLRELKGPKFSRAFRLIGYAPTPAVLSAAFNALLDREAKMKSEERNDVTAGIAGLAGRAGLAGLHEPVAFVKWIKEAGGGGGLGDALQNAIGWNAYEALDKALAAAGAEVPKEIDQVEKVRLRALDEGGGSERIYLLRRIDDEDEPGKKRAQARSPYNKLGGEAPGVDASRWPSHDDEPMAHLFTLDVKTMPELAGRVGTDARLVSVFCWQPDNNEAYSPGNGHTAVVVTTQAQLDAGGSAPDEVELMEEQPFEVVAVDVSPDVWDSEGENNELRGEIYRCHARVLGEPIWLQDEEGNGGTFVMQFDEGFCHMNLGDSGVMYVCDDDAWWQCH